MFGDTAGAAVATADCNVFCTPDTTDASVLATAPDNGCKASGAFATDATADPTEVAKLPAACWSACNDAVAVLESTVEDDAAACSKNFSFAAVSANAVDVSPAVVAVVAAVAEDAAPDRAFNAAANPSAVVAVVASGSEIVEATDAATDERVAGAAASAASAACKAAVVTEDEPAFAVAASVAALYASVVLSNAAFVVVNPAVVWALESYNAFSAVAVVVVAARGADAKLLAAVVTAAVEDEISASVPVNAAARLVLAVATLSIVLGNVFSADAKSELAVVTLSSGAGNVVRPDAVVATAVAVPAAAAASAAC